MNKNFIQLTKPRIVTLVVITTALGFILGKHISHSNASLIITLIGTALSCAGAGTLNSFAERDSDRLMKRTAQRPLPTGAITPTSALVFGVVLTVLGIGLLAIKVNFLTATISLLTVISYIFIYTPLKKISWLNTFVGAVPGALPPVGGWAAATGSVSEHAWILFLIMFVWQIPHFYAIAWMYKDDYKLGGFKMLPVVEPDGKSTMRQIIIYSLLLFPVSLLPYLAGFAGEFYMLGVVILDFYVLNKGITLTKTLSIADARKLLKATVYYLPLVLVIIFIEGHFLD